MQPFNSEFKTLTYVIEKSNRILLVAHTAPDGDTTGAVLAMHKHIEKKAKHVDIACYDEFPQFLEHLSQIRFAHPDSLEISNYDAIIGCDSVDRGFGEITKKANENAVSIIIDHHPDTKVTADVEIIDPKRSSACELVYDYLSYAKAEIDRQIATFLMIGIISDTGNFQHANTTTKVMNIASDLMKKGASMNKIIQASFANKKISTLKLWGVAFEKAKINKENGMIVTVLTKKDIEQCNASTEDIGQVASILNTVPGTMFSLILSEREEGVIKGSLRSEDYKGVDVSKIAHKFGGGGHRLASGFTIKGKIIETDNGWKIL